MNIKAIRELFPIFRGDASGERLVYLDTAATSQRPSAVIDAVTDFYTNRNTSVHRGVFPLSEQATQDYEDARELVQTFINAKDPSEIIFTAGTTAAINFIADTWARDHIKKGDEIVVTQVEHHANLLPWQRTAKRNGAVLKFLTVDPKDFLVKDHIDEIITNKTKLVSVVHVSNVLGKIWREGQLEKLIKKAHSVGAKVLLDCAQSVAHQVVDVQKLDADFVVFSGHKMLAPTGVGVLYIKKELHDDVEPYQVGGSMIHDVSFEAAYWAEAPEKYEAGTPPIAQVLGLGAAVEFFNEHVDFAALHKHESQICRQLVEGLSAMKGVTIFGNQKNLKTCGHLVTFVVDTVHAHDVAAMLGMQDICVRAGHHCVQPYAKLLDIESSVRASFYMYNQAEDIEILLRELHEVIKMF